MSDATNTPDVPPALLPGAASEGAAPVEAAGAGWWAVLGDGPNGARVCVELHAFDPRGFLVGEIVPAPAGTRVLDTWADGRFSRPPAPAAPPARVVSAAAFYALFTPDETTALCGVPEFTGRAIQVLAQGTANLDSDELAELLGKAVTLELLTDARARQIAAGEPPSA